MPDYYAALIKQYGPAKACELLADECRRLEAKVVRLTRQRNRLEAELREVLPGFDANARRR